MVCFWLISEKCGRILNLHYVLSLCSYDSVLLQFDQYLCSYSFNSIMKNQSKFKKWHWYWAFEEPQLLNDILNHLACGSGTQSEKALPGPILRLRAMLSLISSHSMPLPWGWGCSSRVSQGQDKRPRAWNHNPPTWAWTAGKLHTINKHRCAIITGCLLRYQDRLSFPICQFKNIVDGLRWTQSHCEVWI